MDPYVIFYSLQNAHKTMLDHNVKILSQIFNSKVDEICQNCRYNYTEVAPYHYEIISGKRKRIYAKETKVRNSKNGCCTSCASSGWEYPGFFSKTSMNLLSTYQIYEKLKLVSKFNDKTGFFNTELCKCSLPRLLRSNICLTYTCDQLKLSVEEAQKVIESSEIIRLIKIHYKVPY